jgi:riboflavin biosynthesis RibT protein
MLTRAKDDHNKIVMGLLAYSPEIETTQQVMDELEVFETSEDREFYLWKDEHSQSFIGLIGVEEGEDLVLVRYITLSPSYRDEGISKKMLEALSEFYPNTPITGTLETTPVIAAWQKRRQDIEDEELEE